MVLTAMSFGGPNNSVVRDFVGGVRAASYWIGNRLLSASDIVNDSSVSGANVKLALNYLSTSSTAVFPFVASGLAEQDLVSYDAGAATWKNRTVTAALNGKVTSTMVSNASTVVGATVTAALNTVNTALSGVVSPYLATSLAEQDILSYDAGAGQWINRTKATALKGTGLTSFVVGSSAFAAGTNDIILGTSAGTATNTGSENIGIGTDTLDGATVALQNMVAIGSSALSGALTAAANGSVAIGSTALRACTTGRNTAVGFANQIAITTGTRNTTVGYNVMSHASTAVATSDCVGVGNGALAGALTATANGSVAVGSGALASLTSGLRNTAVGYLALDSLTTSSTNTAMGYLAGQGLITGIGNSLFGQSAMYLPASSSASYNAGFGDYVLGGIGGTLTTNGACAFGAFALSLLTSGGKNTAVGFQAGNVLTTGANMSILGYNANGDNAARSGCVVLGTNATATVNDTLVIRMGDTSTKEIVVTPVVNATPPAGAVTYLPITIGGTSYKILLQAP